MKMFLFDRNQKVKRWLVDRDFVEAKMVEQINAADQLTFSVPLNKRLPSSYFYAAIPQPRGSGYLLFKIVTEKVSSDQIEYTAVESAYDELKSYHYIKDVRPENRKAGELLQTALEGTRWQVGQTYDSGTFSTNFYYISTLEAIQKIVELCGLEVTFEITLNPKTHKIEHRLVNLYAQQGQRTGKRFEYGSNLLTVEREESAENLITALIGRGKGEAVYHEDNTAEETPDGYGRRINFADVVWSKKNGNPADKPVGQEYVEDVDATAKYGFDDGKPRIGIEIFEDITDPTELLQATWSALQTLKRPQASFRASVMDVGDLGLGDTVAIVRHDIKIEYFTRVYKVTHNLLDERQNTIELGDDFSGSSITSTVNNLGRSVGAVGQLANYAAVSANGKNANYYGQAQPINPLEGDLWYKDLGNGETDMYQYHAGNWILITSTRDLHNVEKQVKQAQDDFKTAWNKAVAADSSAAKAQQRADDVGEQLQSAQADFDSRLTTAMANASSATAKAQQKADDVGKQLQSAQADFDSKLSAASASASSATAKAQQRADDVGKQLQSAQADFDSKLSAASASASAATAKAQQRADDVGKQLQSAQADFDSKLSAASASASAATDKAMQAANAAQDDVNAQIKEFNAYKSNAAKTYVDNSTFNSYKSATSTTINDNKATADQNLNSYKVTVDKTYVAKGTVISNVNTEANASIFSTDNKLYMDAATTVFSGKAFIPNAAIINLTASKLTAGTIDASKISVVNLNASNINTGTLNASLIKAGSMSADRIVGGTLDFKNIDVSNLSADNIVSGTLDASKVSVVNLNASNINTGTLNASLIKAGSMSADRIVGGTLDFENVAIANLSADNIVSGTLDASEISVINLDASNINTGTLDASLIKAGSMSADRIVGGTLNFKNVGVSNLSAGSIVSGTLDASKVSVINLNASNINTGSLNAGLIKVGSMSADRIVGGTLNFKNIGVSNLSAGNIVSGTLDAAKVSVINLNASNIKTGTLDASLIKAGSMSADRISGGTLDFSKVNAGSLSADKITSGTLNAGKVNVINLNANNITSGTINGQNLKINLNTGEILFQKGKIASTNGLLNINVDDGTMSVTNILDEGAYFRNGNIELTNFALWNNGENPAYGKIAFAQNMFESGNNGIEIQGKKGWIIHSENFDYDKTFLQHFWTKEKTGTSIGGDESYISLQAYDGISLVGGAFLPTNLDNPFGDDDYKPMAPYINLGYNRGTKNHVPAFNATSNCYEFNVDSTGTALSYGRRYFTDTQYGYDFRVTLPWGSYIELSDDAGYNGFNARFLVVSNNTTVMSFDANGMSGLPKRRTYIPNLTAGSLNVTGSKNAIVPTSAGATLINAYETAEYYFGDIGESTTDKSCVAQITIDPLFLETINTSVPYQVFLSSYDNATVWVESRTANLFVVKSSKPNTKFCWELKAKRKGYEDKRLEVDDSISAENLRKQVEKNEQQ